MAALFQIALLASAFITTEDIRKEFPILREDQAIVKDAISRWVQKVGGNPDEEMRHRIPIVVYLDDKRCVILHLRAYSVGGSPVYCYASDKDVVVSAMDDVE